MPTGEEVAAAWRIASPAAVHPELDAQGQPVSSGSAETTMRQLVGAIREYSDFDPPDLVLLDYGGGPGRIARLAAGLFHRVIVADTNPAYLEIAADIPEVETLLVDTTPSELPDLGNDIDVILCINVFLHLPVRTAISLLRLFADTIPADGLIALQIPLYDRATTPDTWTSVGTWTENQLRSRVAGAGLVVRELHTNRGVYVPGSHPGANHARLHILGRP